MKKTSEVKKISLMNRLTSGFHITTFSKKTTIKAAFTLLVFYILGGVITGALYENDIVNTSDNLHSISFLVSEIIPIILIMGFMARKPFSIIDYFLNIGKQIKKWFKLFINDFKHKWLSIFILAILTYILIFAVETIMFKLYPVISNNNITSTVSPSLFSIIFTWFSSIFLAPIFEELVYRKLLPNLLTSFFATAVWYKVARFLAITFSALYFVGQHNLRLVPLIVGYFASALFLQKIADKSNSLTAPIMVHSVYNLISLLILNIH